MELLLALIVPVVVAVLLAIVNSVIGRHTPIVIGSNRRPYATARACPECGSREFRLATDQDKVYVIQRDRVCRKCNTRYKPPTPLVAVVTLGVLGCSFMALSIHLYFERSTDPNAANPLPGSIVIAVFGMILTGVGFRKLLHWKREKEIV